MSTFLLRVVHPDIDPREITETLGLPPLAVRRVDGGTVWETALAGNETSRSDVNSALNDIAARFEHYRFFVDEIRDGDGRMEIVLRGGGVIDGAVRDKFRVLNISLTAHR